MKRKVDKENKLEQNEYYSLSEQKTKLLATVTLNQYSAESSAGKGILNQNSKNSPNQAEDDFNTLSGQNEEDYTVSPKSKQIKETRPGKEERKSAIINDSEFDPESIEEYDLSPGHGLRAGSFKSLQDWGDNDSESNNESRNNSHIYLNYPREKMPKEDPQNKADKGYNRKSWLAVLNKSVDITEKVTTDYFVTQRGIDSSQKRIAEYFENQLSRARVTSLEIKDPANPDTNQHTKNETTRDEENIENQSSLDQIEREEIIEMRMKFLKQKK